VGLSNHLVNTTLVLVLFLFCFSTTPFNAQVTEEWVATYNGRGSGNDEINAIAVDLEGNIYVTGRADRALHSSYEDYDYTTIKYNPAGDLLWLKRYYRFINCYDGAVDIALNRSGDVYVTGLSNSSEEWEFADYATVRYDTDGAGLWEAIYGSPLGGRDMPMDMVVDGLGYIYVTGCSRLSPQSSYDYATIKYNPRGRAEWIARYNRGADEIPCAIAVDAAGNVYITGKSGELGDNQDIVTLKYDSEGNEEWVAEYPPSPDDEEYGNDIAVDNDGNVYVTGYAAEASNASFVTIKYDSNGVEQWVRFYYSSVPISFSQARLIDIDQVGNIIVCGESDVNSQNNADIITIKYDPEGNEIWSARYEGYFDHDDVPVDMALDREGSIYITGYVGGESYFDRRCVTIKYDADGVVQWLITFTPELGDAVGQAIALDRESNVYVGGFRCADSTWEDYMLIKYNQNVEAVDYIVEIEEPVPVVLCKLHPNPFNPVTTLAYDLPEARKVNLQVFNLKGELVETLIDGMREAGHHKVTFDASELASGVYLYRLTAGENTVCDKMVLIK
jgi:uncharacterized delta-60 repeat protein